MDANSVYPSVNKGKGKVKVQTPKVEKQEKNPKGRAEKRMLYNRRIVNVTNLPPGGERRIKITGLIYGYIHDAVCAWGG